MFHFLEVNPRPWGAFAGAEQVGVDLFTPLAELLRREAPHPDLAFRNAVETRVLPLYLMRAAAWLRPRMVSDVSEDLCAKQGRLLRGRLRRHVLYRLLRVGMNRLRI